ncbi:MAG TPA: hypothetical protein VFO36_06395, partial [Nitrospiraceae bacterium]|nr:hypothetical protein [Nitrospiraceae bacterium]
VNMAAKSSGAIVVIWAIPLAGIFITALMAHFEIKPLALPSFSFSLPWRSAKQAPAAGGAR